MGSVDSPGVTQILLQDVAPDAEVSNEVSAHLEDVRSSLAKVQRLKARGIRGKRPGAMEILSEHKYGDHSGDSDVDDSFFNPEQSRGLVRLRIAKAQNKAGTTVRRWKQKRGSIARLGGAHSNAEDGGDLSGSDIERMPSTSTTALFSTLGRFDSVTRVMSNDSNTSLGSYTMSQTGDTPDNVPTPPGTDFPSLLHLPTLSPLAENARPSGQSSGSEGAGPSPPRPRPPSRTLTLDNFNATKPRRRDSRIDVMGTRSRVGSIKPKDFQRLLARRLHKLSKGEVQLCEVDEALEAALAHEVATKHEDERTELDVLYEHQRGLVAFGVPYFSSAALTQFDPAPWTDGNLKSTTYTRHNSPPPGPFWHWTDHQWMVDMGGDTDEQGWSYAIRFRSRRWRGTANGWRSFTRRRRWIRARIYLPNSIARPPALAGGVVNWDEEAIYGHGFDLEEGVTGLKRATALLPLSPDRKDDVLGWEMEIDARDPFLAWSFIQYQGEKALQRRKERTVPGSRNDEELMGLWRDSLIEVNYRKVARALKSCRLDREKIDMWRWWLGLEVIPAAAEEEEQELHEREGGITAGESVMRAPNAKPNTGVDAKSWKAGERRPNISDVWDLIEGRLELILLLFEFQLSRLTLLHFVLELHPVSHMHHRYRSHDRGQPFEPGVLSPELVGSRLAPRIDFYTDVQELKKFYEGQLGVGGTFALQELKGPE